MTDTALTRGLRSQLTRGLRLQGRRVLTVLGTGGHGRRHPLLAVLMVAPPAMLFAVGFGGWDAVVVQASSVAVLLGR